MAKNSRLMRIIGELSAMLGNVGDVISSMPTYNDPFPYRLGGIPVKDPLEKTAATGVGTRSEKRRAKKLRNKKKAKRSKRRR